MKQQPRIAALIVAAGRGIRAGGGIPKQYRKLNGEAVLTRTLRAFTEHPGIDAVQVVIHPHDRASYDAAVAGLDLPSPATGGASRAESVLKGLRALSDMTPEVVLVHDAARPFVSPRIIDAVIDATDAEQGAVATIEVVDAMRMVENGRFAQPVSRENMHRVQTPQGFPFRHLFDSLENASDLSSLPDDATAVLAAGLPVVAVPGDPLNIKLTTPEDFAMAERMLASPMPDVRHGTGFDVHAFCKGSMVTLCGITIPHDKGLTGHSDADVGLHALTDAILGAAAMGDIGRHFPPSDPQWKGADSAIFLAHAVEIVRKAGFVLSNVDVTLICERPKIGPHSNAMRARIASICGLDSGRVSVKATTTEQLGFCGREEGISALASACLIGTGT